MSIPKSVLIVGGSSQIGLAIAKECSAAGAVVSVISRQAKPELLAPKTAPLYWFQDAEQSEESCKQQVDLALEQQPETIFICNGVLHNDEGMPEKNLLQLKSQLLEKRFHSNVTVPALYLQALYRYLTKKQNIKVLVLSAKVGSISDNKLGGWYSYRMTKAALNMLIKNLSIEIGRVNKSACLVTLHPGTTATPLSEPFQKNLPEGQLQTPHQTAIRLLKVSENLKPEQNGQLLNWDATKIPF
ncbi:SDR family NAD(P)-dependent oxidoreductase [Marinospirillum minutulum]|uniref:SDR family NAD(P)-dependent oxidoreductase n=1 Tax=Marinospirillum minutulum TaxID=64974 RepID=UPI00041AE30F|nr:SDR family NAD(P)-dependent oxidoreductase [Marinospirillum minutulum]